MRHAKTYIRRKRMESAQEFVSRVLNSGRITIPKDARETLGIKDGDYLYVRVVKLDLFRVSMHRAYLPHRMESITKRQVSATEFGKRGE